VTSNRQQAKTGLSVTTLTIASLSSLAAALVVSKLWGGGTLFGAAMTPVIVALVSEGLRRPATIVTSVRETRSSRYDPVAEGRAGLREGDLDRARPTMPAAAAERRVHRVSGGGGLSLRLPPPRVIAAVVTGLVAFVLVGVLLTGSELVLGKSVVSPSKRTTFVPVRRNTATTTTTKTTHTTPTTTTTTPTTSTPTSSAPPATSTTPTVPPTQTAPPATTTPAPQAAPPATPTTPAPQSATPPASTTP
jgi:hypothetical protein